MSSIAGGIIGSERAAYCASKGAIVGLTKSMAMQLAHMNIRVNAIVPGAIDTPALAKARQDQLERPPRFQTAESVLGRIGRPEEIAYMALFLASDESSYAT